MAFLLEHLPAALHLVIASRADPPLPLARLRARGELVEVRAADLRFTPDEAAAYLNEAMGLDLTAHDVAALEGRTEGWIAALQLAALSMQGRDDVARLHRRLRRRRPVHRRLPGRGGAAAPARAGPRRSCSRHRPAGPVDRPAVRRRDRSGGRQGQLGAGPGQPVPRPARRPPALVPLPPPVRRRAAGPPPDERTDEVAERCTGAPASGTSDNGEPVRGDPPRARRRRTIERAARPGRAGHPGAARNRQEATLRRLARARCPTRSLRVRPVLSVGLRRGAAVAGTSRGRRAPPAGCRALARRGDAVTAIELRAPSDGWSSSTRRSSARCRRRSRCTGPRWRWSRGDVAGSRRARPAGARPRGEDDHIAAGRRLGLSRAGALDERRPRRRARAYAESHRRGCSGPGTSSDVLGLLDHAGRHPDHPGSAGRRAAHLRAGPAGRARRTRDPRCGARRTCTSGMSRDPPRAQRPRDAPRSTWRAARSWASTPGCRRTPTAGGSRWPGPRGRGRLDGALALLDDAERVYVGDFSPNVRPVPALRARVLDRAGQTGRGLELGARAAASSADDDLAYLREFEHITLARVLLARSRGRRDDSSLSTRHAAPGAAARRPPKRAGGRAASSRSWCCRRSPTRPAATSQAPWRRCERAADPGGAGGLRPGIRRRGRRRWRPCSSGRDSSGPPRTTSPAPGRVRDGRGAARHARRRASSSRSASASWTCCACSATDLDGPDIARELVVSLNTMRTHTKNIYAKLGVNSRRAAVRRATELDLLPRDRRAR